MSGSGRETLWDVQEWSGSSQGFAGVVGKTSRMSGSGRMPSRMSEIGREALPDVMECSEGPPGYPGGFRRPSEICGSGRDALLDVR